MQVTLVDGQPKVTLSQKEKRTLRDAYALVRVLPNSSGWTPKAIESLWHIRAEVDPEAPTTPPNASEPKADKTPK